VETSLRAKPCHVSRKGDNAASLVGPQRARAARAGQWVTASSVPNGDRNTTVSASKGQVAVFVTASFAGSSSCPRRRPPARPEPPPHSKRRRGGGTRTSGVGRCKPVVVTRSSCCAAEAAEWLNRKQLDTGGPRNSLLLCSYPGYAPHRTAFEGVQPYNRKRMGH